MKLQSWLVLVLGAFLLAQPVHAHVTVNPKEVQPGYSVAGVRVPNEKDIPTTEVHVIVPKGVAVHGIMPVAGWKYAVKRSGGEPTGSQQSDINDTHSEPGGAITEITWTGGEIKPGEFMEFPLSVQYEASVESVEWKAFQTYEGGEVVSWDGSEDGHPAAKVTVGAGAKLPEAGSTAPTKTEDARSMWIASFAMILSVAALAVSIKKKG